MRNEKNIFRHEIIGLKVEVIDSKNKYVIGLNGKVIYETKNILEIEKNGKVKRIVKDICKFRFYIPEIKKYVVVNGKWLVGRPEDRIKKKIRIWH